MLKQNSKRVEGARARSAPFLQACLSDAAISQLPLLGQGKYRSKEELDFPVPWRHDQGQRNGESGQHFLRILRRKDVSRFLHIQDGIIIWNPKIPGSEEGRHLST